MADEEYLGAYYTHPQQLEELRDHILRQRLHIKAGEEFIEWLRRKLKEDKWEWILLKDGASTMAQQWETTLSAAMEEMNHSKTILDRLRELEQYLTMQE